MSYLGTIDSDLGAIKWEVNNKKDKYNIFFTCRNEKKAFQSSIVFFLEEDIWNVF